MASFSSPSGTVPVATTDVATTPTIVPATIVEASAGATPVPFFAPAAGTAYTVHQHPWHMFPGAYNSSFLGPLPPGYPAPYAFSSPLPPTSQAGDISASLDPSNPFRFTAPFASFRPPASWNTLTFPRFARGFQAPGCYPPYQVPALSSSGATDGTPANGAKASRGRSVLLARPSLSLDGSRENLRRPHIERPLATKACDKVTVAIAGLISLGTSAPQQPKAGGAVVAGEHFGNGDASLVKCDGKESEKQKPVAAGLTAGVERRRGAVWSNAAAADCSSLEDESVLDGEDLPQKELELGRRKVAAKKEDPESHDLKNPWNEGMVRFLFESYEAIHTKLNNEASGNGQGNSKYHKKWSPILCLMKEKFGREFTKHQCQSKYYKVRRECSKYTLLYKKKARSHPSAADRELQRPKFYEIWQEFGSKTGKKNPQISPLILELCMSDAEEASQEIAEEEEEEQAGSEDYEKTGEDEDPCSPSSERTQQYTNRDLVSGTETNSVVQERRILNISIPSSANTQGSEDQHVSGDEQEEAAALGDPIAAAEKHQRRSAAGSGEEGGKLWKQEGAGLEHGIGVDLNLGVERWDKGRMDAPHSLLGNRERQYLHSLKRKRGATTLSDTAEGEEEASLCELKQDTNRLGFELAKRIKKVDDLQLMRDMQVLLCNQLKACEKQEESICFWGEAMGGMLKQHVECMQTWGASIEQAWLQQSHMLECMITKLESLMHQVASLQSDPPGPATPK